MAKALVVFPSGNCKLKYCSGTEDVVVNNKVVTRGRGPVFVEFRKDMGISAGQSLDSIYAQIKKKLPNVQLADVEKWLLEKISDGSLPVWDKEMFLRRTAGSRIADASREIDDLKAENESLREKLERMNKGK